MPFPGDIILNAVIKNNRDPKRNSYWLEGCGPNAYIKTKHAIEQLGKGRQISKLICLPKGEKYQPFAQTNYESRLIDYFYYKNGRLAEEAIDSAAWISKWNQAALNPQDVVCENPNESSLPDAPLSRKWQFAKIPDHWLMPVTASEYPDFLNEQFFCPNALVKDTETPYVLPSVYKRKLYGQKDIPPLGYQTNLVLPIKPQPKTLKQLTIYLHGTLDPKKWHYDIRNHMLSATSFADQDEKKLWKSWLRDMPDEPDPNIFSKCSTAKQGGNCGLCSSSLFQEVHNAIVKHSQIYWNQAVMFWESDTTKQIEISPVGNYGFHGVTIKVFQKTRLTVNGKKSDKYPLLLLKGWSYNYGDSNPILHLNIVTFYITGTNPGVSNHTVLPQWELQNVKRI